MSIVSINTLTLDRLKNAEHVQFHTNVRNIIEQAGSEECGVSDFIYDPYRHAISDEQDIVNKAQGSAYTLEMQQADAERDRIYKSCRLRLELVTLADPSSEAYKLVGVIQKHLLGKYAASVTSLPYQEETATITGFILDCRTQLTSQELTTIGISKDVDDLEVANQKFSNMYQQRVAEKAAGDTQLSLKLRAITDEAYQLFAVTLNANANDPNPQKKAQAAACQQVIDKINVVIRDAKNRLAQRLGAGTSDLSSEESAGESKEESGESSVDGAEA